MSDSDEQVESDIADTRVYYSTPFGDTKDGGQKLFLLQRDGVRYFPVFRSEESLKAFCEAMNRAAYMVLEGDLEGVMDTVRSIDLLKNAGIVIEPFGENPVEITPSP